MPDGNSTVIIQGKKAFKVQDLLQEEPYFKAKIVATGQDVSFPMEDKEFDALILSVKDLALQIIKLSPNIPSEAGFAIRNIESPGFLLNFIASNLNIEVKEKQSLLEAPKHLQMLKNLFFQICMPLEPLLILLNCCKCPTAILQ